MRHKPSPILLPVTLSLVVLAGLSPQAGAAPSAQDDAVAALTRQAEDWNRGDLEAFTAVYADDAVFLAPSGVHRGRAEVLARYLNRYPDRAAMGTLSFEVIETRESGDGSLVTLAARWHLAYPEESDREDASGLTLLVLRRDPEGWKILQDASM